MKLAEDSFQYRIKRARLVKAGTKKAVLITNPMSSDELDLWSYSEETSKWENLAVKGLPEGCGLSSPIGTPRGDFLGFCDNPAGYDFVDIFSYDFVGSRWQKLGKIESYEIRRGEIEGTYIDGDQLFLASVYHSGIYDLRASKWHDLGHYPDSENLYQERFLVPMSETKVLIAGSYSGPGSNPRSSVGIFDVTTKKIEWFPQIPELKITSRSGQSVLTKEGKVVWVHGKTPPFVLAKTR